MTDQLYPNSAKNAINRIEKLKHSQNLSPENIGHLLGFINRARSKGLSDFRILFYLDKVRSLERINYPSDKPITLKDFKDWGKHEIEAVMADINSRGYKKWTIHDHIVFIRALFRYLYDLDNEDPLPKFIRWLRMPSPKNNLTKEDLLTQDELKRIIGAAPNTMWKALLHCLFEGALRPKELRSMTWGDVHFQENKIKAYVLAKKIKGEENPKKRPIFLISSYLPLRAWMEDYPREKRPSSPLWLGRKGGILSDQGLRNGIQRIVSKTGIKKSVWPYLFRHTQGTRIYKSMGSVLGKRMMGHTDGTRMIDVYCHTNEDDIEAAVDKMHGITPKKEEDTKLICPRCSKPREINAIQCRSCNMIFSRKKLTLEDLEERIEKITFRHIYNTHPKVKSLIESSKNQIRNLPEIRNLLREFG